MSYLWELPFLLYVFSWIITATVSNVVSGFTIVLRDRSDRIERFSFDFRKVIGFARLARYTIGLRNFNRTEERCRKTPFS